MFNFISSLILFASVLLFVGLIGCVLWFLEETKIGKKLADKLYNYFMES